VPEPLQAEAGQLLAQLHVDQAQQRVRLETLETELPAGDLRRGQTVFQSAKAMCALCHAVGYLGGRLGPDLSAIGPARSERDLLEAIVFPSASFVRSYEPMIVRLKGGEEVLGILRSENPEMLTLATGPATERRIERASVAEMLPGTTSLMPPGMDQVLTRQELADLLAFLKGPKSVSR
jgi:putative heme-binding domain-containing protein